jgi:hypothetical protein
MVRRPDSIPEARRAMNYALQKMNSKDVPEHTFCQDRPVPYTEVRQTPDEAAKLCHKGEPDECKLLALCQPLGFTESVYADDMVYGGLAWRRGLPVVSETGYQAKRAKNELKKLKPNGITNGNYS